MTYARQLIVYGEDGETPDETVYTGGIITDAFGVSCVLSAMGGCLGGQFSLPGSIEAAFALQGGQIVKFWADSAGDPIYMGEIVEVKANLEGRRHDYTLRGLWDRVSEGAVPDDWADGLLIGADVGGGTPATVAGAVAQIYDDSLTGTGIAWSAPQVAAPVPIDNLILRPETDIKTLVQQLAYQASAAGGRVVAGVDGTGTLYLIAIPTAEESLQGTSEIGLSTVAATEQPTAAPFNVVRVVSDRRIPDGVTNNGYLAAKTFTNDVSIAAYGRSAVATIHVVGIYQENDLKKVADGWLERAAETTRKVQDFVPDTNAAPPIPWLGRWRYIDNARDPVLSDDLYIDSVDIDLGTCLTFKPHIGAPTDQEWTPADAFSPAGVGVSNLEPYPSDPPYDVTDVTNPPANETTREVSPAEIAAFTGGTVIGGTGNVTMTRGYPVAPPTVSIPLYDSVAGVGRPMPIIVQIFRGATELDADAVTFYIRRLNSAGIQIGAVVNTFPTRLRSDDGVETWTDAVSPSVPYTPVDGDYQIQVGVEIEIAAGSYIHWPAPSSAGAGADPDWLNTPTQAVVDPSGGAGGGEITGDVYLLGWPAQGGD